MGFGWYVVSGALLLSSQHAKIPIGTDFSGKFLYYQRIRAMFLEDKDGTILVGSGKGLFRFHPETHKVEQIFKDEINELVLSLSRDRHGNIWVGTF